MALDKKVTAIYKLMEHFLEQREIANDDAYLLDKFECSSKTLERYLKEIEGLYDHIITIKQGRRKIWKLVSVSDILEEFIKNSNDISELFLLAQEFDSSYWQELESKTLAKVAKNDEMVFLFKNSIMEDLKKPKSKEIFNTLKRAIKNRRYIDIEYVSKAKDIEVKPIKLVFMDNNWYIAIVKNSKLMLKRVSFIKSVSITSATTYQLKSVDEYLEFLPKMQNSMTLYKKSAKIAKVKATAAIAQYFKEDMKRFLPSQKYIETLDSGEVIFSLEYTQELEIMPLIQKWMPDLIILEPQELREHYKEKLQNALKEYK